MISTSRGSGGDARAVRAAGRHQLASCAGFDRDPEPCVEILDDHGSSTPPAVARIESTAPRARSAVWDAATGKPLAPALEHQGPVVGAAFSPDGTRVVTASDDHTARVWDAATGKPLTRALAHQGPVRSAAFSSDGTRMVTASDDKTARVWGSRLDETPPAGWSALAARSPFVLNGSVHVLRESLARETGAH